MRITVAVDGELEEMDIEALHALYGQMTLVCDAISTEIRSRAGALGCVFHKVELTDEGQKV